MLIINSFTLALACLAEHYRRNNSIPISNELMDRHFGHRRFSSRQGQWLAERDGRISIFPEIDEDTGGIVFDIERNCQLTAHHIHARNHIADFMPQTYSNHPLNGISLSPNHHLRIHQIGESRISERLRLFRGMTPREAGIGFKEEKKGGYPIWDNSYDEILSNIAIINSYFHISAIQQNEGIRFCGRREDVTFPFGVSPRHSWQIVEEIYQNYETLCDYDPNFVCGYIDLYESLR